MRFTATTETEPKLATLVEAAQSELIFIDCDEKEMAVLMSASDYSLLSGNAAQLFNQFCDTVADNAAARGMTEEKLEELLKHG